MNDLSGLKAGTAAQPWRDRHRQNANLSWGRTGTGGSRGVRLPKPAIAPPLKALKPVKRQLTEFAKRSMQGQLRSNTRTTN
jgi:hypothetical protein